MVRTLISTCTERKERLQRQRERTPFLSIRLRQGRKPCHERYARTLGGVRRILRLRAPMCHKNLSLGSESTIGAGWYKTAAYFHPERGAGTVACRAKGW